MDKIMVMREKRAEMMENILRPLEMVITTSGEHKINITATKPVASWIEEGASLNF